MNPDLETRIAQEKQETIQNWITHIDQSIEKALRGESQLTEKELSIRGFSPPTQRHLWSNLMANAAMYVEAGLFGGASFCSTLKGNKDLVAVGIDDLSQPFGHDGIFEHLKSNLEEYKDEAHYMKFIQEDFFSLELDEHFTKDGFSECEVFYYDAVHSEEAQAAALPKMLPYMRDVFVYLCDDYDWPQVRSGTDKAIQSISGDAELLRRWHLTDGCPDGPRYHNGVFIGLFKKIKDW